LGTTFPLNGMRLYNVQHSGPGPNGLWRITLSADILVSSLAAPGNPIDDPGNWTKIADDLDLQAPTDLGIFKSLPVTSDVRWVAWADIVANEQFKDCCANDAHYVQLQEIRFFCGSGARLGSACDDWPGRSGPAPPEVLRASDKKFGSRACLRAAAAV